MPSSSQGIGSPSSTSRAAAKMCVVGSAWPIGWRIPGSALDRVEDARQRHQHRQQTPGEDLGALPDPQDQPDHDHADRPADEEQQRDHGHEREAEVGDVEREEANATVATTVTPSASFARPNSTTPPTYSHSRSGVTIRLSRLRDHVSSMKPVARLTSDWNTTWKSRMPASRYADALVARALLLGEVDADGAEHDRVDDRPDDDVEPALRRALEHVGVPARHRADPRPAHDVTSFATGPRPPRRGAGTRPRGRRGRSGPPPRRVAVGDDPAGRDEHDPLAEPLDLDHVVAGDEQRGAVLGAQAGEAGADLEGDVGVERGRRLVEHQQRRPVQRGLDDADERALARRELVAHRVGQRGDAEPLEPGLDLAARGRRSPYSRPKSRRNSPDAEPLGQGQVAGGEADVLGGLRCARAGSRWPAISTVPGVGA